MKTKLITALRATAHALESGTFAYEWRERSQCNCGALFCALSGLSATQLRAKLPPRVGELGGVTWRDTVGQYCTVTGIPTNELLREVMAHGLTHEDIVHLENLSDPKVVDRMIRDNRDGLFAPVQQGHLFWATAETPDVERDERRHAAAYMRAWADLLTEEGAMDTPETSTADHAISKATA